ncbi:MFS multidrug transporter [Nemania sp. FL0031]|nr:MFS multidrug transporter [Nemania sp. FL0031]
MSEQSRPLLSGGNWEDVGSHNKSPATPGYTYGTCPENDVTPGSNSPVPAHVKSLLTSHGLMMNADGFVRWENSNPKHPRNWGHGRKIFNTLVIHSLEFVTSMAGTAGTPAAQGMQKSGDFAGVGLAMSIFCLTSSYLLGQGLGGVFFPPYSEIAGRKTLYIASTAVYALCSIFTASLHDVPSITAARFLSGLASAVPTIVVAGSMEDIFNNKGRVWAIFIWAVAGNAAVCVGPIYGSYVTARYGWRWVFYIAALLLAVLFILCLCISETRPSLLLERQVSLVRKELPPAEEHKIHVLNPDTVPGLRALLMVTLLRPVYLLFTEPIIAAVAIMGSLTCALFYMQAESLMLVFRSFGWSSETASLAFIPILMGCLFSSLTRVYDHWKIDKIIASGRFVEPEDKLTGFSLAAPCLACGLWVFAWSIPPLVPDVHWLVPLIAQFSIGYALNENVYTLTGYLADSYTIYAASGFAGLILARATTCAVMLPLTAPMYEGLGYNLATSVLAVLATLFVPVPFIFGRYGKRIRKASRFASSSRTLYHENRVEDDMGHGEEQDMVGPPVL